MSNVMSCTGMNLAEAVKECARLNCEVWIARRTGEFVIRDPDGNRVRVNSRRKDAPRALTTFLNRLKKIEAENEPAELEPVDTDDIAGDMESVAEDQIIDQPDDTKSIAPEVVPTVPMAARLSTFLSQRANLNAMRAELENQIAAQQAELASEQELFKAEFLEKLKMLEDKDKELTRMLAVNRDEMTEVKATMRSLGIDVGYRAAQVHLTDEQEMQNAYEFLLARRGVWCRAGYVANSVGSSKQFSLLIKPLLECGKIEKRGEKRGTEYRVPSI